MGTIINTANWRAFNSDSKTIMALALPMVASNISLPLVGLVDTAIVGHLGHSYQLAGVALASMLLSQIYWICSFLRMATTGRSAIYFGSGDGEASIDFLKQSLSLAALLAVLVWLLQIPLLQLGLWIGQASEGMAAAAREYFSIRIWAAPFALTNLVLVGWMVGQQMHRTVMKLQIAVNLLNMLLSYGLAVGIEMGVSGVAVATVMAEVLLTLISLYYIGKRQQIRWHRNPWPTTGYSELLSLNHAMFARNILLQLSIAFITFSGLRLGELYGAVNAVLTQFFVLIALGLDGLANAVEALVGQAKGQQQAKRLRRWVKLSVIWSCLFALAYSLIFLIFGKQILGLLTNLPEVLQEALHYLPFIVLLPLVGHWCFLLDGIFIGVSQARPMRNTMLMSILIGLLPAWYFSQQWGNAGLWFSFLFFLAMRGVTLGWCYWQLRTKPALLE